MSRFSTDFQTPYTEADAIRAAGDYLTQQGFSVKTNTNEEGVWQKGHGVVTAPQFIKLLIRGSAVHIEAWIKFAVLPGVYAGEMNLEGVTGIAAKKPLKKHVDGLIALLSGQPAAGR